MSDLFTESTAPESQLSETPATTIEAPQELVSLVQGSGLEVSKQNEIAATLSSFFAYAATWTKTVDDLVITSPTETGKMGMARTGRLDLRSKRLEAEKLVEAKRQQVKAAKSAFDLEDTLWLKAGQMMVAQFRHLEGLLEEKEKFAERYEAAERARIAAERREVLVPLGFNDPSVDLGTLSPQIYEAIKANLEKEKADREAAAAKAEADRIAAEQAAIEERRRIEEENARLKAEAEAKEKELAAERAAAEAKRIEAEAKAKAERDAIELKAKQEREAAEKERIERERVIAKEKAEAEAAARVERERINAERREVEARAERERAEAQAKIDAERARVKALEDSAKAKEDSERKEKADREAREKAEESARMVAAAKAAKAPKKEKLTRWIDAAVLEMPAEFGDDPTVATILQKFDSFKTWAKSQIDAL